LSDEMVKAITDGVMTFDQARDSLRVKPSDSLLVLAAAIEKAVAVKGGEGSGNFDHAGRPGLVGGSASTSADSPIDNPLLKDLEDKYRVKVRYIDKKEITAHNDLATAYYDKQNDIVYVDKDFADTASQTQLTGVIAHEAYHAHEKDVDKQKLIDLLKSQTDSYLDIAGEDMSYDERAAYEDDYKKLIWEQGGPTSYSNEYFNNRVLGFDRAVSESLAEVARLKAEGESSGTFWDDIYDAIFTLAAASKNATAIEKAAGAVKGGEGSGNFDHAGRPGLVGGSAPSGATPIINTNGDFKKIVRDFIKNENENGLRYYFYGIRIESQDRNIGDRTNNSMHNPNREDERSFPEYGSEEYQNLQELNGSSAWRIDMDGYDEDWTSSVLTSRDKDDRKFNFGDHIYIIAGNEENTHSDADPNEIVIGNAVVVYKIQ